MQCFSGRNVKIVQAGVHEVEGSVVVFLALCVDVTHWICRDSCMAGVWLSSQFVKDLGEYSNIFID